MKLCMFIPIQKYIPEDFTETLIIVGFMLDFILFF